MRRVLVVLAIFATAGMPIPAYALFMPDLTPKTCIFDNDQVVQMPCARERPAQLATMRSSLVKSFVPMECRATGVRFNIAGVPFNAGGAVGLVATSVFRGNWSHAHVEQTCRPTRW